MTPKRTTRSTPTTTTTPTTSVTDEQLKRLIDQGIADALAARDTKRSQNGKDNDDSGTGVRRQAPPAHECTYPDFMKCKPLYFKGTEGVIELTQWFERMEIVFRISNCSMENQIKLSTCTLLGSALTWWNSHVKMVGHDELALMCSRMFPEVSDKIEKYVGGLSDMIHGSDAIKFATKLMDKKIRTFAERQSENKRKQDDNHQQQTRSRTLAGLMLQGLVRRNLMKDLNLFAQNVPITMMVNVLQNATSATELAIWLVTVGVLQMPTLLTTKEALGQVRNPLAMNVEPRDISRGIVQS
ncbi:hypothetical protein Tco_0696649 [Tanacetum coccineum]